MQPNGQQRPALLPARGNNISGLLFGNSREATIRRKVLAQIIPVFLDMVLTPCVKTYIDYWLEAWKVAIQKNII
eukprot:440760-Amphidinium_carterae.1